MPAEPRISAILLAGGQGRRMGGLDKGLIPLAGRPLIAHVVERLSAQVDEIVLSANRNLEAYAALGWPVVSDARPGPAGPLAGVLAAGRHTRAESILVAPCDTPFLPLDLAHRLAAAAQEAGRPLARAADPERVHYALMWLRRTLLEDLDAYLAKGGEAVRAWQERHAPATARFEDRAAFRNLNDPAELIAAEAEIRRRSGSPSSARSG